MAHSLYERLKRVSGLAGSVPIKPAALADLTGQIQRGLAKLGQIDKPALALGAGGGVAAALRSLGGLKGLHPNDMRPQAATPTMLARDFSSEAGSRPYKLYVPPSLKPGAPLVVMLHGCTQSAMDFAAGTRMNALAEAQGFVVLYPEQLSSANSQRCWNWFNPGDRQRDRGEAAVIAGMTKAVLAEYRCDPRRVFAAGLSAGGAQAAILGATYPDLYAAIGVHSGLACGAAHDVMSAFSAMQQGRPGQGDLKVPAILFHGDRDSTVNPRNADEIAAQYAVAGSESVEQGVAPGGLSFTRKVRIGAGGKPMLEQWRVHGAGHAWSGGSSDGSFTEPRGPDASREMLRFFLGA